MKYLTWAIVCLYRGVFYTALGMVLIYLLSADPASASFFEFLTMAQDKAMHRLILLIGVLIAACVFVFKVGFDYNPYLKNARMGGASASDSKPVESEQQP